MVSARVQLIGLALGAGSCALVGCAVAPNAVDRPGFKLRAEASAVWFRRSVYGLRDQLEKSGGYVVFPDLVQWGTLFGGGTYGRGTVCDSDGSQVGWASLSTGSLGLQAGAQGLKMLVVFENAGVMRRFQSDQLFGTANAVAIVADEGASARVQFDGGVVVYEGANEGLMAGVNLGLNFMQYEPLSRRERLER